MLKPGDKGPQVQTLQRNLIALGYDPGGVDGDYGTKTTAAVLAFQLDYSDVADDGIAGPQTERKIATVLAHANDGIQALHPAALIQCNAETWAAWEKLVALVTKAVVGYGPGRGLWVGDRYVITHGPGALNSKGWASARGHTFPSFHCTSWANFVLGWLGRRNDLYTPAGNIPELFDLLAQGPEMHEVPQDGWTLRYRGYGDMCSKITPDGSGARRSGVPNVMDARELYDRRGSLPTFVVCGQSSKMASGKMKWWHHVVFYVVRDGELYRIAADGFRDMIHAGHPYSASPMFWTKITTANLHALDGAVYRAYGVNPNADGSYGDQSKPIAAVELES